MKKTCMLAILILMSAGGASAAEPAQTEAKVENQSAQADAPKKKEKKICRKDKVTGSLTRVRVTCLTRAQWNKVEADTKKDMDDITRNANGGMEIKNPAAPPG